MTTQASVFHTGEKEIHQRLGISEKMEAFGRRVVREYMPGQHRDFYQQLPFIAVGHIDDSGNPWATLLVGEKPGFIQSPDDKTLRINALRNPHDPLFQSLDAGAKLGLLGIELHSRRRNRLAASVRTADDEAITLHVDQAFGNCPQYIQTRALTYVPAAQRKPLAVEPLSALDSAARQLVKASDTLFVASYFDAGDALPTSGADVSHRGGKAGFVHIEDNGDLIIPDYAGNNHFNTLGNFLKNPRAGLLFVDFEHGHMLSLTGKAEILWDDPRTAHFNGAHRLWRFRLTAGQWLKHALPYRWQFGDFSPNSLLTGDWQQAVELTEQARLADQWQAATLVSKTPESDSISSFVVKPSTGLHAVWKAGQFLPIQVDIDGQQHNRTYTLSSAPDDGHYRISVKREADGTVSRHLHDHVNVGDTLLVKAPAGAFHLQSPRPAVLIAAGVGVTPFVSMLRQALVDVVKSRTFRPITLLFQVRDAASRPFFDELNQLAQQSDGLFRVIWSMSQPEKQLRKGQDFHYRGRIDRDLIKAALPLDDYDFYVCGPGQFMQDQYDNLLSLGVQDGRIFAEAFGPAALKRQRPEVKTHTPAKPAARNAVVTFDASGVEQAWSSDDGSLLEFAEKHGMSPAFGCRNGQCGACKVKVKKGSVSHLQSPDFSVADDEALLCCSVPADDGQDVSVVTLDA